MAFFALEKLSELYDGYQRAFSIDGHQLLLCQVEGKRYVIENRCPHMDVSLTAATQLPGGKIRCNAHGIEFELDSGRATGPLADTLDCLHHYTVVYDENKIGVELE